MRLYERHQGAEVHDLELLGKEIAHYRNPPGPGGSVQCTAIVVAGSRLWQESLRDLLTHHSLATVAETCGDFDMLETLVAAHRPDLLVAWANPRDISSPDALLDLRAVVPQLALLVLLPRFAESNGLRRLAGAGSIALMTPDAHTYEIQAAVPLVLAGWTVLSPDIQSEALADLRFDPPTISLRPQDLTERRRLILQEVAQGSSDKAIAALLGLSVRAVQLDIARLRRKLGASDRTHVVALAIGARLIDVPPPAWEEQPASP